MKNSGKRRLISLFVAALFVLSGTLAFAQSEKLPWDGLVELSTGSIAAGIGFSWGGGTLTLANGQKFPIKVDGLSVGSVGISEASAWGKVYNLKKVEDFAGTYVALDIGVTVGGGGAAATMKNQNGVILDLYSTNAGVKFTLGTGGVKISLK